jgi:deoxyribodipyrimidine photo-lyase
MDELKTSVRYRDLSHHTVGQGPIVYWMNRDQRVDDNHALLTALTLARKHDQIVHILFVIAPSFGHLSLDFESPIYRFMGLGLKYLVRRAKALNLHLTIQRGDPLVVVPTFLAAVKAGLLVTDFSPLKQMRFWRESVAASINVKTIEVDAHNIIPAWVTSDKQEWGAYTIRPKIHRLLPSYLLPFPDIPAQSNGTINIEESILAWLERLPDNHDPVLAMRDFITKRLPDYHFRNNPNLDATSHLSAYLHFGQLSAQRLALEVRASSHPSEEFLEEMIVRRELADNYCLYNPDYDSPKGFPDWARKTLLKHQLDRREYIYTNEQFEQAKTHDPVWNAAQSQLLQTGYMHGYMRMYWAKKILEWTPNVETAFAIALSLNDKYQLDGRDPNGYTGIAWALGGVHDRPWGERPVFGMIRYMNMAGLKRKFGIDEYIAKWQEETRLF